jgi:hypothetical protein
MIASIAERVRALGLDLSGKVVLTEAATGAYCVTPVIAALAGARVYAYSKNTKYGSAEEAISSTERLCGHYTGDLDITYLENLEPEIIAEADIITNSGHLRPLAENMLQYAKDSVVIPLMYEAWEWRNADMDMDYIRQRGIMVGATNERHPDVDVFNFLGDMAIKLILDAGLSLYGNKFILICNNDFGPFIAKTLARVCDGVCVIDKTANRHKYNRENIEWVGGFPEINIPASYKNARGVLFTAYPFDIEWIGNGNHPLDISQLIAQLTEPFLLRYGGDIDTSIKVPFYPLKVSSGHMGILPSSIGFEPVIRLQAGGLKAAEAMISGHHFHRNHPILELI